MLCDVQYIYRTSYTVTQIYFVCIYMAVANSPASLVVAGPVLMVAFTTAHVQVINNEVINIHKPIVCSPPGRRSD